MSEITLDKAKCQSALDAAHKKLNGTTPENENTSYIIMIIFKRDGSVAYQTNGVECGFALEVLRLQIERMEQQMMEPREGRA